MSFKLKKEDLYIENYKSLKIDKQLDHIAYNDYKHVYYNLNTGERYTSVTTLIHMYQNEFDTDKWSKYKAIERLITKNETDDSSKKQVFDAYKKQAGGYNNVVPYFENTVIKDDENKRYKFGLLQQKILDEWKTTNKNSLIKGSEYHKKKEDYYLERCEAYYESILYKVCTDNKFDNGVDYAIYPELLIYNDEFKIAGQADLIIRAKNDLIVRDYKTNKKLDMTNNFQNLLYPLTHIQDCNFNHYQLQLSLYAYMLSHNFGVNVKELVVDHHTDTADIPYPCKYMYDEIDSILHDYKFKYDKLKNS